MEEGIKDVSFTHLQNAYNKLKSEYNKLQSEYDQLQSDRDELQSNHEDLKADYHQLNLDHTNLQNDYSENIIIQSMNEMKSRYERLVQTTVPNFKYKLLSEKYISLVKRSSGCCVFIDYIIKLLRELDTIRSNENNRQISKIEIQLQNIKEILEEELSSCVNPR